MKPFVTFVSQHRSLRRHNVNEARIPSGVSRVNSRPDWDDYFLGIAGAVSLRGDCTRSRVGAVIANKSHRILGTGYNGVAPGSEGCLAGACPRGQHYQILFGHCACNQSWPCPVASEPGSDYSNCIATHAEGNAVKWTIRWGMESDIAGATIYTTREPCYQCIRLLKAVCIQRAVWPEGTWNR